MSSDYWLTPSSWRWKGAVQGSERATFFETHTSETVEIRKGQLDLQYMILNVMTYKIVNINDNGGTDDR
jgi:hypothetical protein